MAFQLRHHLDGVFVARADKVEEVASCRRYHVATKMIQQPRYNGFTLKEIRIVGFAFALFFLCVLWGCGGKEEESLSRESAARPATQVGREGTSYETVAVQNGGTISGTVIFKGSWTQPTIPVTKDQEVCGKTKKDPSLLVSESGEVQNAVVYIADIHKGKNIQPKKVTLDQKDCQYRPHVLAFLAGSTVEVKNPDGILHNIHSYSEKNDPFNLAQPKFKKTLTVEIEKPEIVPIKCDVHGWMSGWFFVAANPYFNVTDNNGTFQLATVPPGNYTLQVWHEKLGTQSRKIEVKRDETVEVKFEFPAT